MNLKRAWTALALTTIALSGCSKGEVRSATTLPQLPEPSPTATASPSPRPSSSPSPRPSASPTPTPSPSATPVACDPKALEAFSGYSSVAFAKGTYRGMNLSHGVAAKAASLLDVDMGYGLERNGGRYDLVVDTGTIEHTVVENGGAAYATSLRFREGAEVFGVVKKTKVMDFEDTQVALADLQIAMLARRENGTVTLACAPDGSDCVTTLKGTDPKLNRFTIGKDHLRKRSKIVVSVPKRATALVVISDPSAKLEDIEIEAPNETVWTMAKRGGKLTLDFLTLTGTVFAIDTVVELDQALVMGRVISGSLLTPECRDDSACATIDSQEAPASPCL
jgi:choice-of-anchor A domain-containing protein